MRLGTLLHFLLDRLRQLGNRRVQPIQQLQQNPAVAGWPRGLTETPPVALVRAPSTTSFCSAAPRSEPPLATGSSSGCAPAPSGAGATAVAADPGSPNSVPRSAETDLPRATAEYAAHSGDRSSACVPASLGSRQRHQSRARIQLRQQSLEPARMPTGFHPHAHLPSLDREIAVELLRFLAM